MTKVLITGAAGNLGSLLSRHIRDNEKDLNLILMQHLKEIPNDISGHPSVQVRSADLSKPVTLYECLENADIIIHFAGVLFKANPEEFLYETNLQYFKNLVGAAKARKISPLTKDFIDIGRVSYYGDTSRFRKELLPVLNYPTINDGIKEMKV